MMSNLFTFCGLYCSDCPELANGCPGCQQAAPAYECAVRPCALEKAVEDCSFCSSFPCDKLNAIAFNAELGTNGEMLETLKQWQTLGKDAWLKAKTQ